MLGGPNRRWGRHGIRPSTTLAGNGMYTHEIEDGICIVNPGAALTLDAPAQFKAYVLKLLEQSPCEGLIVKLADLNRIDSFGIGVIVGLYKTAAERSLSFAVTDANASHRRLFASTGIDQAIDFFDSAGDAISSFRG